MRRVFLLALVTALTGCAESGLSRNLYEGIRMHQEHASDPSFKPPQSPDYDQYERERARLKGDKAS